MEEQNLLTGAQFKKLGRHVGDFFACKCAPDLLKAGIYPDVKEITESAAAHHAVRFHLELPLSDPNTSILCIADGRTPRTAAMFAMRSAWQCHSVDPNLKDKTYSIKRLYLHKCKIEDLPVVIRNKTVVIAAVHSHAPLQKALEKVEADQVHVVAIPCCVSQSLDREPDEEYRDPAVWSKKNRVLIWRNV